MKILFTLFLFLNVLIGYSQLYINEASNKNYSTITDEDGEYGDWIEIYNAGASAVDLFGYSLTDDISIPNKWVFGHTIINAGQFKVVFCTGKDRKETAPFTTVLNTGTFSATSGWNNHAFTTSFNWDGTSNIAVNVCSYSSAGYTINSIFNQTSTSYFATLSSYEDGSDAACSHVSGGPAMQRPNVKINGLVIGTGTIQNSATDYPAPYGNWYWGARCQMLFRASELTAAGLTAGPINSLAFDVVSPDPAVYDYIEISMKHTGKTDLPSTYIPLSGTNNHTNFTLAPAGEFIYLHSPVGTLVSMLFVNCSNYDNSVGLYPDATGAGGNFFDSPTPGASNNSSASYTSYSLAPSFSTGSGFYTGLLNITITNPNTGTSSVFYTLDGSDPTTSSTLYTGTPIPVYMTTVLKARAFTAGKLPSSITTASYFYGINHTTPILSVITENDNLYGPTGIFDNYYDDWLKPAYAEYFDSTALHNLVFSKSVGMIMDGGAGGSRSNPQHSFRIEMDNGVLGGGVINSVIIPDRPERNKYGKFYLRNGSNQYLNFPYKDACQVKMMCKTTHNYYSAWRPVSVYINGQYFGLYELREKFDTEMFKEQENANPDSTEILSLSYFYGGILRAVEGSVDNFWISYNAFTALNTTDTSYWTQADNYFDMPYYCDYIIAQSWMSNVDWPFNNIKIYRSDVTNKRWRFCIQDLELSLNPGGWTNCNTDHIDYMLGQSTSNPYINIWLQSIQNTKFKNYFINRFADVMNTEYDTSRLLRIENSFFNATVAEMPKEYDRWGNPFDIPGQMTDFYNRHTTFQDELICRTEQVRNHIESNFSLNAQVRIDLDVLPINAGKIQINTIQPQPYPWSGIYFDGVPVTITAMADTGYIFSHWVSNGIIIDTLNPVYTGNVAYNGTLFRAIFYLDTLSGINEQPINTMNFTIYPNLTENSFTILNGNTHTSEPIYFNVCSMNGDIVQKGKLNEYSKETYVDVKNLNAGMYIVKISNSGIALKNLRLIKL